MLIYLATPYTHKARRVENFRAKQAAYIAGKLMQKGFHVISPVVMCHPINRAVGLGGRFEYWREFDSKLLAVCGELWIVQMEGWDESVGIKAEIQMAQTDSITIRYVNPITLETAREPWQ